MQKILNILLIAILFLISCEDQNYLHNKYLAEGEIVYDGKVKSIEAFPGISRVKLKWVNTFDSKVIKCAISWNNGKNSRLVNISDVLVDSKTNLCEVIIDKLEQGYYTFELNNQDAYGNVSLPISIQTKVIGDQVISEATNLLFESATSIGGNSYVISLTPKPTVYGVKFTYEKNSGGNNTFYQKVVQNMNTFVLKDAKPEGNFSYISQYFLPNSIDSFYTVKSHPGILSPKATNVVISNIASIGNNQVTVSFDPKSYSTGVNFTYEKNGGGTLTKFIQVTAKASSAVLEDVMYEGAYSYTTQYGYQSELNNLVETVSGILPSQYIEISKSGWKHLPLFYDLSGDCWGGSLEKLWDGVKNRQFDLHTGCDERNSPPLLISIDLAKPTLIKGLILTSTGVTWNGFPIRVQLWGITNLLNPEIEVAPNDPNWQAMAENKQSYKLIADQNIPSSWASYTDYSISIPNNTNLYQYVRVRLFGASPYITLNEITIKGLVP